MVEGEGTKDGKKNSFMPKKTKIKREAVHGSYGGNIMEVNKLLGLYLGINIFGGKIYGHAEYHLKGSRTPDYWVGQMKLEAPP